MILHTIPAGMNRTNCYIVGCEETHRGAVIDPGGEGQKIVQEIERSGLEIQYVLVTHAHFDHIGGIADVIDATAAKLALHPNERPLLEAGGGASIWGLKMKPSPPPDIELYQGQLITLGALNLEVLFTPGHSPGGVTFYEAAEGVAFDGDLLFSNGIGRTDLLGGDRETLMRSIKEVLFALPDDTVIYPGHGPKTTVEREKRTNPWIR
ncbi:MAG: MBL fold metallo-hydrolase [Anaerolineae bacterium]|jgi:glyoxylase-like metal-dependent hydrolase (beta-lactamase superfamily II)